MRLIDADILIEKLKSYAECDWNKSLCTMLPSVVDDCIEFVDEQPTAYDIDRAMVASAKAICVGCGYLEGTKCTYTGSNCGVSKPMLEAVMKALEQLKAGASNGTDSQ